MSTDVVSASPELHAFAERQVALAMESMPEHERRREKRVVVAVPATVQKVDDALKPLGQPFAALTRDLNTKGVGLIVESQLQVDGLFAIEIGEGDDSACLLSSCIWCQPLGPYYLAGFRAVEGLISMP